MAKIAARPPARTSGHTRQRWPGQTAHTIAKGTIVRATTPLESRAKTHSSDAARTPTTIAGRGARTSSSQEARTSAVSEMDSDSLSSTRSHWMIGMVMLNSRTAPKAR